MKGIILYAEEDNLKSITRILVEGKVEGITHFEVQGRGKLDRKVEERTLEGYSTGKTYVPAFIKRIRVETIVPDSAYENIITTLKKDGNIKGKIFVYDIHESHDL